MTNTGEGASQALRANRPVKRSVVIKGHKTSVSLEPPFWSALKQIADQKAVSLAALIAEIDAARGPEPGANLSSALRVFVLEAVRQGSTRSP